MALRIGIAGSGAIAGVHMTVLKRDERVEIASIFGPNPARGGALAAKDFDDMLGKVDAVFITAPNHVHADLTRRSLAAGKHVFCEKPMATTIDAARKVLDAAGAAKAVFQVGFNRRFAHVYRRVKELVATATPHTAHIK